MTCPGCPAETWPWLFQAPYFMRGFDLDTGEFLGAWEYWKTTPGRETPFTLEEMSEYGDRLLGGDLR